MTKIKRYKPLIDKLFYIILLPTSVMLCIFTFIAAFAPISLLIIVPVDLLCLYFIISPLFGYVELRENSIFVKFGFFVKREISYSKIRDAVKVRKFYSDSMISLKNSFEHVNVKYNTFDILTLSVKGNDEFIDEIKARIKN